MPYIETGDLNVRLTCHCHKENSAFRHIFRQKNDLLCDTLNSSQDMLSSLLGIYSVVVAFHLVDIACVMSVSTGCFCFDVVQFVLWSTSFAVITEVWFGLM